MLFSTVLMGCAGGVWFDVRVIVSDPELREFDSITMRVSGLADPIWSGRSPVFEANDFQIRPPQSTRGQEAEVIAWLHDDDVDTNWPPPGAPRSERTLVTGRDAPWEDWTLVVVQSLEE